MREKVFLAEKMLFCNWCGLPHTHTKKTNLKNQFETWNGQSGKPICKIVSFRFKAQELMKIRIEKPYLFRVSVWDEMPNPVMIFLNTTYKAVRRFILVSSCQQQTLNKSWLITMKCNHFDGEIWWKRLENIHYRNIFTNVSTLMENFVTERKSRSICFKKRYPVYFNTLKLIYHRFNFVISITKRKVKLPA